MIDTEKIRQDFPILERVNSSGKPLVYLDNAATTQKPVSVIDAITDFYKNHNSNIHRGIHFLATEATNLYEEAREKIRAFITAESREEIIFVRGTTEAINLVASSYGQKMLGPGDNIIITGMEHHSNLIPWQQLALLKGATLEIISVSERGEVDLEELKSKVTDRTRLLAMGHISNSLGSVNPVEAAIDIAHEMNVPVLIDGAQAAGHQAIDMKALDCDFYAFSGHKMYGPTGIGVLYAKRKFLNEMTPYQYGGEMIRSVSYRETTFAPLPHRFEAGTPDIAGVVGLGAAVSYLAEIGMDKIKNYTEELTTYMYQKLQEVDGLRIVGTPQDRGSIISFVFDDVHPHDVATILDNEGIAIRAGHHCTMPLMHALNLPGTTRASIAVYNTRTEVDLLVEALQKVQTIFAS